MNQQLIFDFLKNKYLSGDERFWSSTQIYRELNKEGTITTCKRGFDRMLIGLYTYGYLEVEWIARNRGLYRAKPKATDIKKVLNPLSKNISIEQYRKLT